MDLVKSLAAVIPIVLVCAAILALYQFLPGGGPAPQSPKISLALDSRQPYVSGRAATLRAVSTCGPFGIFIDDIESGEGVDSAQLHLVLQAGSHTFEAKNGNCIASLDINVAAPQCSPNQTEQCALNGCQGERICSNEIFSSCILPRKVCVPGDKIGCSFDGCKFGHAICNPCGSGYGACVLDNAGNSGANCGTGALCN